VETEGCALPRRGPHRREQPAEPKRAQAADVNRRTDEARVIDRIALQACLQGGDELVFQVVGGVNYLVRPATTILAGWRRGMISS